MSTVAEVIEAVKHFTEQEKSEFLDRLREIDLEDAWDRRMAADAKAGRLDFLVREADEAMRTGMLREGPGEKEP